MLRNFAVWMATALGGAALLGAQVPIGGVSRPTEQQQHQPAAPPPAQPVPARAPGAPPATPNAAAPAPGAQAAGAQTPAAAAPLADNGAFMVPGASLTEMIDILAKRLKISYILDPRVRGTVSIYTYGEIKAVDLMQLMQTILRVNGATLVKVGDLYRIIPINSVSQMPLEPTVNADPKTLPDDERMILDLIFLKYATASEMEKLIVPFLGEGASHSVYEPANLIIIQDNSRSMKRTLDLISIFDSDTFAGQRVKLFEITNSRPSDLVKDLDSVFKAYALSEKGGAVKFLPVDRINTIIAVAPNPGIFTEVLDWIRKLDIAVKLPAGSINSYVYRLKYGRAETVAMAIMALYTGNVQALINMAAAANAGMVSAGMGYTGAFSGMGSGGAVGGGIPGLNTGYGGASASPYGAGYGGLSGTGYGYPATGYATPGAGAVPAGGIPGGPLGATPGTDLTGSYLGAAAAQAGPGAARIPHVIPNPFDNSLLIQGTPQEYEQIVNLVRQLDIAPRQVLIEAKIYEVDLSGAWSAGVESYLQAASTAGPNGLTRALTATAGSAGLGLSIGAMVSKSQQLLAALNASELSQRSRVISAPSIIATDSIPATLNVGDQVPVLTSQAATGVQSGGNTLFANNISEQSTGVTLSIMARVNTSGIVTMIVNQQVSAPEATPPGASDASSSFSNRSISTQMTVQDGDTVAIGGIITETRLDSSGGVPFLHRIPILGAAFGAKMYSNDRKELIIFLTPRVIYDASQILDATDEIKSQMPRLQRLMNQ